MPPDEPLCLEHRKPLDDHTLRELRVCHPAEQLNQPYAEVPEGTHMPLEGQGTMCGGVVVRALVLHSPNAAAAGLPSAIPTLGFQFFEPDGITEVAKVILPLEPARLRDLRVTVGQAIDGAILMARRAR